VRSGPVGAQRPRRAARVRHLGGGGDVRAAARAAAQERVQPLALDRRRHRLAAHRRAGAARERRAARRAPRHQARRSGARGGAGADAPVRAAAARARRVRLPGPWLAAPSHQWDSRRAVGGDRHSATLRTANGYNGVTMEALLVWTLAGAAALVLLRRARATATLLLAAALVAATAAGHARWASTRAAHARDAAALAATLPRA